jgi:pyrroloquinoline quinone biosynthesis protein B
VAPDVAANPPVLNEALQEAGAVLFDGTFWSAEELRKFRPDAPRAEEMGHLPIHDGSLPLLQGLKAARKIYLHINNTNPILQPDSPERAAVEKAGIEVGSDGLEFDL